MNQNKRQLSIDHSDYEQTKRLCNTEKKSITCMENLSNDLLLEVFDYFDGYQLYKSFWNLKTRFQNLLVSSSYPLKFTSLYFNIGDPSDCCRKFIYPNRHRIISLNLSYWKTAEIFFKSMTIDQAFQRLESLVLSLTTSIALTPLLRILTSFPRLYSLDLSNSDNFFFEDLSEVYRLIFGLPVLKYLRLGSTVFQFTISPRNNDNSQCSTIKCMVIDYPSRLDHLIPLLSNIPQLRQLIVRGSLKSGENISKEISITLPNLRSMFIDESYLDFDQFEPFIMNICSQLRTMRIVTRHDAAYLDANRWERLISKHLPYLQKFDFEHHQCFGDQFRVGEYHKLIPQFMSLFWIKRQWIFALGTRKNLNGNNEIIYSIRPNKRKWYDLPGTFHFNQSQEITSHSEPKADETSSESYISTELTVQCFDLLDIIPLLTIIRITLLTVDDSGICAGKLVNLINHLPNLDTLNVCGISLEESEDSSLKERNPTPSTTNQNKITKVNLWSLKNLAEIPFLLDLCPVSKYLMIKYWSGIDHKFLVRSVLTHNISNTPNPRTMGLFINGNIDKTIEELHEMIYVEELTCEYTIKYIDDRICIQWK